MAKSTVNNNSTLLILFNGITFDNMAINASVSPLTNLYIALHTASPGVGGVQSTNETSYTDYARVAVIRSSAGWTVSGNQVSNTATILFPVCGVTGAVVTHVTVGESLTGAGRIFYINTLTIPVTIISSKQPKFDVGTLIITEN